MRIGLDCDDVLADTMNMVAAEYGRRYGVYISAEEFTPVPERWREILGEEGAQRVWDMFTDEFEESLQPMLGAVEGVTRLYGAGIELVVATNRTSRWYDVERSTRKWLERHFEGAISEVYFTGGQWNAKKSKGELGVELGLDLFVDDLEHNVVRLGEAGIFTLLYDRPWNRHLVDCEKMRRVNGWEDVVTMVLNQNYYK